MKIPSGILSFNRNVNYFFFITVIEARSAVSNLDASNADSESLPSYTIVSGLPSYDEALEQLKKIKEQTTTVAIPHTTTSNTVQQLSVKDLFEKIKPIESTGTK